nr:MAG TPA: hypothetical protein [Bacteriophage sp.]
MHVIKLNGYNATTENGEKLKLGTFDSYGEEQLQIVEAPDWENLSVIATFNPPNKKPVQVVVDSVTGVIKVPKEATADLYGVGTIVFVGLADGVQRISADCEYIVRKHSNASGTEPAYPTPDLLQQVLTLSKDAQTAAKNAQQSANNAEQSAESAAKDAADTVKPYKEEAVRAATAAALSEKNAAESKAAAQEAAERATQAGIAASNAAEEAERSAGIATDAAGGSALNAENARKSALNAQQSANNAAESQSAAAESAQAALESKTAAATSEVNAAASAKKAQDVADSLPADYTTAVNEIAALKTNKADKTELETVEQQVANITPDDSTIGEKPWSSKHIIDMLCPPLEESGNPVVCYPVAGYALGVKASWEPTQEGSGTPYPAGGGKQLLDTNKCVPTVGKPYGMTITLDGDVFKVSGVPNEEVTTTELYSFAVCTCNQEELRGKSYKVTAWPIKGKVNNAWGLRTESEDSLAIAAELTPGVNNDIQLRLMVSKDTPTAWEPYENIRPIRGRDSVKVERCGENLLDVAQCRPASLPAAYGLTVTVDDTGLIRVFGIPNVNKDAPLATFRILFTDQVILTKEYKAKWFVVKGAVDVVTIIQKDKSIVLQSPLSPNTPVDIQFRFMYYTGNTAPTAYEPYTGQTNTLTLPETVYGGSVDAVSGEGQETWKLVILNGTESWNSWGINAHNPAITGFYTYDINDYDAKNAKGICSHLETPNQDVWGGRNAGIGFATVGSPRYFMFSMLTSSLPDISAGHEVASLKAYLAAQYAAGTPVQVCYKLATPVPFTATGGAALPALEGVNTVITDANSVAVSGRADPIKRIEDLEAAVASIN